MERWRPFPYVWLAAICCASLFCARAEAAFVPTDLSGLQLWLDANDVNGDNVANNPSSGTAVSSWVDKSGQAHNATQGTGANQPLIQNAQLNGQSVVRFTGVANLDPGNDFLTTSGYRPSLSSGYSVFIVEQYATLNDGSYLSTADGNNGNDGDLIRLRNNGGSPEVRVFSGFSDPGGGFTDFTGMHGANTPGILQFTNSAISGGGAGTQVAYVDGSSIGSSSLSRSLVNTGGHDMMIGEGGLPATGSPPYSGDIAEMLIFDRVLSADEANKVGFYLQGKYSISGVYAVPEPSSIAALAIGAGMIGWRRRKCERDS